MKIFLFILLIISFLIIGATIRNNILLNKYANQLYTIPLPNNTTQISYNKAVGNLYGTGTHLDFVATIEIQSMLSEIELIDYYSSQIENIRSVDELSIMGLSAVYFPDDHTIQNIEVIPKAQSRFKYGSSKILEKSDNINNSIGADMFVIQIKDTHYDSNLDLRTH